MKNAAILFLLLSFTSLFNLFSQNWIERNSGVTVQLTSVSSVDNNAAWVCGYNGTVLRTTNQGVNWINVSGNGIPANIQLVNIFGIDANTALAAGYIGSNTWVYRTSNAGANWTQNFSQTGGFINAISLRIDGSGFMMGDPVGGRWSLWKTTNNGLSWDSTGLYLPQSGSEAGYNNCLAVALNRIWFGTNNSRIYYSSNNGAGWSMQNTSPETDITSLWFDPNGNSTGYFGGNNVYKTSNYGDNWSNIGSLGTGLIVGLVGLPMWSGNVWYIRSGSGSIYFGWGTGQWQVIYNAPAGTYRHISTNRIPSWPYHGYAVRTNGGISYTFIFVEGLKNIGGEIPDKFSLSQNFPNPFNPETNIKFQIPYQENVKLAVFDMLGKEVRVLVNQQLSPGTYSVDFDASNLPSGVYYYRFEAQSFSETKKMVLVK